MKIGRWVSRTGVVCCGLGLWLAMAPAAAAIQENAGPAPDQPAEPQSIAVSEVPGAAAAIEESLRQIEEALSAAVIVGHVEETLEASQADLDALRTRLEATLARHHLPSELDGIRSGCQGFVDGLEAQEGELREWTSRIEGWLAQNDARAELWTKTETAAEGESAPPAILTRISGVLETLRLFDENLKTARNRATDPQSRLIEQRREAQLVFEQIDTAQAALAASLWVPQKPPLWRSPTGVADLGQETKAVADGLAALAKQLREFVTLHPGRLSFHALLIVALGIGLRRARRGLRNQVSPAAGAKNAPVPDAALRALARPWIAALLLGVVLTRFLHPEPTLAFQLSVAFLSIPILLLVLRGLVPTGLRLPLLGLALLALIDLFRLATIEFDLLSRLLLTVETASFAGGLFWLERGHRLDALAAGPRNPWLRILHAWIWFALFAALGGLLAVTLGYMNLADRILMLVLWGTYMAAMWFAGVHIAEAVLESVARSGHLDLARIIRDRRPLFLRWTSRGVRLLAFFAWLSVILITAQAWEPLGSVIEAVLSQRIGFGQVSLSLGGILAFGVTLWVSWLVARFASFALDQEVLSRVQTAPGVSFALRTFTRYAVLVIGFVVAMSVLGFPLDRLTLLVSALGVGIGFGLQNIVNNFVSGVILLTERRIRVDDVVELDTLSGKIKDIGIRASTVRTWDGSDVIVPNGDLVGARVVNWTLSDQRRRMTLRVGVAHGTDAKRVLTLLDRVAREHDEVLEDPPPQVLFKGFAESSLEFELRAWTESDRGWPAVRSDLAVAVQGVFTEDGIEIALPQRDLRVRNVGEIKDALDEVLARTPGDRSS